MSRSAAVWQQFWMECFKL